MSRGGGVFDRGAIQVLRGLNVGADRCVCPKSGKCKDESGKLIEIFRFAQNDSLAVFVHCRGRSCACPLLAVVLCGLKRGLRAIKS